MAWTGSALPAAVLLAALAAGAFAVSGEDAPVPAGGDEADPDGPKKPGAQRTPDPLDDAEDPQIAPGRELVEAVRATVGAMASAEFETREKASRDLVALGPDALGCLKAVLRGRSDKIAQDPEVRVRVETAIVRIRQEAREARRREIRARSLALRREMQPAIEAAFVSGRGIAADAKTRTRLKAARIDFEFTELPLDECLEAIEDKIGIPIIMDPRNAGDDVFITLTVHGMSADMSLEWVGSLAEMKFAVCGKGIAFGKRERVRAACTTELAETVQGLGLSDAECAGLRRLIADWIDCTVQDDRVLRQKLDFEELKVEGRGGTVTVTAVTPDADILERIVEGLRAPGKPPEVPERHRRIGGPEVKTLSLDLGECSLGEAAKALEDVLGAAVSVEPVLGNAGGNKQEHVFHLYLKDIEAGCAGHWLSERTGLEVAVMGDDLFVFDPDGAVNDVAGDWAFDLKGVRAPDIEKDLRTPLLRYLDASLPVPTGRPLLKFAVLRERLVVRASVAALGGVHAFLAAYREARKPPEPPVPAWRPGLERRLAETAVDYDGTARPFHDICKWSAEKAGVNVVASRESLDRLPKDPIALPAGKRTAKEFVEALARKAGGAWSLEHGAVVVRVAAAKE